MHALAGLQPARGPRSLDGRDLLPLRPQDRSVGVVFQDQRLFPHLSARRQRRLRAPRPGRVRDARPTARARDWLDRLGVADLADRRPRPALRRTGTAGRDRPGAGHRPRPAAPRRAVHRPRRRGRGDPADRADRITSPTSPGSPCWSPTTRSTRSPSPRRCWSSTTGGLAQQGSPTDVAARPRTEHVARLVGLNVIRDGDRIRSFSPSAVTVSLHEPDGSARNRWSGTCPQRRPARRRDPAPGPRRPRPDRRCHAGRDPRARPGSRARGVALGEGDRHHDVRAPPRTA